MTRAVVLYVRPRGDGWGPITALARLSARLLEAELLELPDVVVGRSTKLRLLLPRLHGADRLLVIAPNPEALLRVVEVPGVRTRFRRVVGWVIDCWWTNRIPSVLRASRLYDHLLVTEKEVVGDWAAASRAPVTWLPLGADVLAAMERTAAVEDRAVDVQRMGRQAPAWDDDAALTSLAAERGLVYAGRTPMLDDPDASYAGVLDAYARAKTVTAFTNRVSAAHYTHPEREYVTSRWLDALAHGAHVVGTRPREVGSDELLWDDAVVDVDAKDASAGLEEVARLLGTWTPQAARSVQLEALRRLDWRWRLQEVARLLEATPSVLATELNELRRIKSEAPGLRG